MVCRKQIFLDGREYKSCVGVLGGEAAKTWGPACSAEEYGF